MSQRDMADGIAEIERRIDALERELVRLKRTGPARLSSGIWQTTDRVADVLAGALAEVSDRFRGLRSNAEAAGSEAMRMSNTAVRRLSDEVAHRPLMLLAVAAGIGLLAGFAGRRRW
jgi:ElaB/YqjD/DUF883 family membrane-anchored ribosome-binding protein